MKPYTAKNASELVDIPYLAIGYCDIIILTKPVDYIVLAVEFAIFLRNIQTLTSRFELL